MVKSCIFRHDKQQTRLFLYGRVIRTYAGGIATSHITNHLTTLPVQRVPFPVNPSLQVQVYDPMVLLHVA